MIPRFIYSLREKLRVMPETLTPRLLLPRAPYTLKTLSLGALYPLKPLPPGTPRTSGDYAIIGGIEVWPSIRGTLLDGRCKLFPV